MYKILLLLLIGLLPSQIMAAVLPHTLKTNISWKYNKQINKQIKVKSIHKLHNYEVNIIKSTVKNTQNMFNRFYKSNCNPADSFELRIITIKQMNSERHFYYIDKAGPTIYGRYFGSNNIMYISRESLYDTYVLEHEMVHYLYDECMVPFNSDNDEHKELDKFLNWKRSSREY